MSRLSFYTQKERVPTGYVYGYNQFFAFAKSFSEEEIHTKNYVADFLKEKYRASMNISWRYLEFESQEDLLLFLIKWSR